MANIAEQDASEVIEADAEVEGDMLGDEELDAAFEAEHGNYFKVLDQVGEAGDDRHSRERSRLEEQKRFVIPKVRADKEEAWRASTTEDSKHERPRSDREVGHSRHLDRAVEKRSSREHDKDERSKPRDHDSSRRDKGYRSEKETSKDRRQSSDRRDKSKNSGESKSLTQVTDCQNGDQKPSSSKSEERISLFDSFAAEGLISDNALLHSQLAQKISEQSQTKKSPPVKVESASNLSSEDLQDKDSEKKTEEVALTNPVIEESPLEIPMGRDSLVFVREFFSWQVRVYPIEKKDITRADFGSVWSMVDSSSVVWSTSPDFGGVAEFLLKDHDSIQKFTRKILWYTFSAEMLIVEITERNKADPVAGADVEALDVINHATIRFDNAKARQLIKTYYPSPQGEVTERSLYINNVAAGVSTDIVKAIFPCALKITVPKAGKDVGSFPAIVEVESEGAAFNYLVVYGSIRINSHDLVLSSVKHSWQEAKAKFAEKSSEKGKAVKQPLLKATLEEKKTAPNQPPQHGKKLPATAPPSAAKRPISERTKRGAPAKRGRASPGNSSAPSSVGQSLLGSRPRGALLPSPGAAPPGIGMGRGLLPKPKVLIASEPVPFLRDAVMAEEAYYNEPMVGSDALLPTPQGPPFGCQPPSLLSIPMRPTREGILEADFMLSGVNEDLERRTAELKEMHQKLENKVMETRASLMRVSRQHFSQEDADMDLRYTQREAPRHSLLETPMSSDNQPFRDDPPPRRPDTYLPPPRRMLTEDSQMRRQPVDDIPPPLPPPPLPPRRAGVDLLQRRPVALLEDPGIRRESAPRRYPEEEEKPLRSELPPPRRGILKERPRSSHEELEDTDMATYRRPRYPPSEVTEQDLNYTRETRHFDSNYNERAITASSYMYEQPATEEEEEQDRGGYDYEEDRGGYARSSRSELPDLGPHERRLLLRSIAEPDRSNSPAQRSREEYDYNQLDARRLPSYPAGRSYEDEDRRSTPSKRFRDDYEDYDHRY